MPVVWLCISLLAVWYMSSSEPKEVKPETLREITSQVGAIPTTTSVQRPTAPPVSTPFPKHYRVENKGIAITIHHVRPMRSRYVISEAGLGIGVELTIENIDHDRYSPGSHDFQLHFQPQRLFGGVAVQAAQPLDEETVFGNILHRGEAARGWIVFSAPVDAKDMVMYFRPLLAYQPLIRLDLGQIDE